MGERHRLLTRQDLDDVAEPAAAVLWELPQRDLGGQLPEWDELVDQVDSARDRGAAAHLDGARLWEAAAGYGRRPGEIAALFDTAYVSFYKGIGALPGCCVVGPEDVVAQVRDWRQRLGGTLFAMWPAAASALHALPDRLAEMPARLDARASHRPRARRRRLCPRRPGPAADADDAPAVPRVRGTVHPERAPPRDDDGIWVWPEAVPTDDPDVVRCELSVGRATCRLDAHRVAEIIELLCA